MNGQSGFLDRRAVECVLFVVFREHQPVTDRKHSVRKYPRTVRPLFRLMFAVLLADENVFSLAFGTVTVNNGRPEFHANRAVCCYVKLPFLSSQFLHFGSSPEAEIEHQYRSLT